jgi:hypothetical protein
MGSFHRTAINSEGFIRGAARLLIADTETAFPNKISDVITLASGANQYDPASGWTDLGATKTGITITRNNTEETFDVDQIATDIGSQPVAWEMSVATALAQATLDKIDLVWEGGGVTAETSDGVPIKRLPLGAPESYAQRRLAVLFKRPAIKLSSGAVTEGKIRAYVFRKVQRSPQESSFAHQRTGDQATLPIRWRCLADDSVADINARFGEIFDQV